MHTYTVVGASTVLGNIFISLIFISFIVLDVLPYSYDRGKSVEYGKLETYKSL